MNPAGFVFLAEFQLPSAARDVYTTVDHLCLDANLVPDARHTNKKLFNLNLKQGERALITAVHVTYCASDLDYPVELSVAGYKFVVPPHAPGVVPRRDQLLFRSRCTTLREDVLAFIGAEHSVLNRRSTAIVPDSLGGMRDWCYFKMDDPFATFVIRNRGLFKEVTQDDVRMVKQPALIQIRESAVDRVCRFFEREVFPLFTYTTEESIDFDLVPLVDGTKDTLPQAPKGGCIVLHFKCEYHVVAPCTPSFAVLVGEKF